MPDCLLCGCPMVFGKTLSHRRECDYYTCHICQFSQIDPVPSEADILDYYVSGAYRLDTRSLRDPDEAQFHEERERARGWLPFLRNAETHLDIGSSTGKVLETMAAPVQIGVEPGAWGQAYGALQSLDELDQKPDLVTCLHTLEHVHDPIGMLEHIRDLGARQVAIELPRLPGWGWPHLWAFTPKSILDTLERVGMPGTLVDASYHLKILCEPSS